MFSHRDGHCSSTLELLESAKTHSGYEHMSMCGSGCPRWWESHRTHGSQSFQAISEATRLHEGERGEAFRRRIMSRVEREGLTLQLKVFPSHLYTYSSINVSCARPLSVRHSSPNKQNRSSCRLCAPPSSLPQPYRADRKDGIPKMQLSDRSTMQRGYSGVAIETNMVPFMWLPLYNIIS